MTAKEFVKSRYPKAKAERRKTRALANSIYWLIRDGNAFMYMAEGETESKAWIKVKKMIQESEANNGNNQLNL